MNNKVNGVKAVLIALVLGVFGICDVWATDSHFDCNLEDSIVAKTKTELQKNGCNAAQVIVVVTATGKIKAKVAMRRIWDDHIVPFWDAFNEENSSMLTGPAYLALMESKKVTPENAIDTEQGIYGEVRDHNWRRGEAGARHRGQSLGKCYGTSSKRLGRGRGRHLILICSDRIEKVCVTLCW